MVFAWREADSRRHAYLEIAKLLLEAGAARTKAGRMQCLLTGFHVRVREARYPSVELLSGTVVVQVWPVGTWRFHASARSLQIWL